MDVFKLENIIFGLLSDSNHKYLLQKQLVLHEWPYKMAADHLLAKMYFAEKCSKLIPK